MDNSTNLSARLKILLLDERLQLLSLLICGFVIRVVLMGIWGFRGDNWPIREEGILYDEYVYYRITEGLLQLKLPSQTNLPTNYHNIIPITSLVLLPTTLLLSLILPMDIATQISAAIIGASGIIPVWLIAKKLNYDPKTAGLIYCFNTMELGNILSWGGYNLVLTMILCSWAIYFLISDNFISGAICFGIIILVHRTGMAFALAFGLFYFIWLIYCYREKIYTILLVLIFLVVCIFAFLLFFPDRWDYLVSNIVEFSLNFGFFNFSLISGALWYGGFVMILLSIWSWLNTLKEKEEFRFEIALWTLVPLLLVLLLYFEQNDLSLRFLGYLMAPMALMGSANYYNWDEKTDVEKIVLILLILLHVTLTIGIGLSSFYWNRFALFR